MKERWVEICEYQLNLIAELSSESNVCGYEIHSRLGEFMCTVALEEPNPEDFEFYES